MTSRTNAMVSRSCSISFSTRSKLNSKSIPIPESNASNGNSRATATATATATHYHSKTFLLKKLFMITFFYMVLVIHHNNSNSYSGGPYAFFVTSFTFQSSISTSTSTRSSIHTSINQRIITSRMNNNKNCSNQRRRRSNADYSMIHPLYSTSATSTSTSSPINIQKQQRENELELHSYLKRGKTQEAIQLYHSICDAYYNHSSDNDNDDDDLLLVSPTVRLMNYAIDACARAKPYPYTNEAMSIYTKATSSLKDKNHNKSSNDQSFTSSNNQKKKKKQLIPNVYTFGSLIRSYARMGDVHKCIQLVDEMKSIYDIQPNSVIYSTIISACEHVHVQKNNSSNRSGSNKRKEGYDINNNIGTTTVIGRKNKKDNVDVRLALQLFQQATNSNIINHSNDSIKKTNSSSGRSGSDSSRRMDNINIVVYNTVLSVFAKAGEWKLACQLLDEMEQSNGITTLQQQQQQQTQQSSSSSPITKRKRIVSSKAVIPPPDHITYGTVMAACERAKKWHLVLDIANRIQKQQQQSSSSNSTSSHKSNNNDNQLDVMSLSSALKACQQLGLADEALLYLNQMKKLTTYKQDGNNNRSYNNNETTRSNRKHQRNSYQGPDDVAYRLAISACARAGYMNSNSNTYNDDDDDDHDDDDDYKSSSISMNAREKETNGNTSPRWIDGIRLLREMEEFTGSAPDVIAYTAAIGGCAVAGEYLRAIQLLKEMKKKGVEPNTITFTAVISACASACAKKSNESDVNDKKNNGSGSFNDEEKEEVDRKDDTFIKAAAMKAALSILSHMTRKDAPLEIQPNIVTYNAAIRACAEGLNVSKAFALLDELKSRKLQPTIVTYGTLMTACERVGDVNGATKLFRLMREERRGEVVNDDSSSLKPNEIIYGAAISCFRKASQSERTLRLLQKMMSEKLTPNTATFNTVLMSQMETKNTKGVLTVYNMMMSSSSPLSTLSSSFPNSKVGRPNRQSYNMLIRYMALNSEPANAEYFLKQMSENGMKPDVDLFTLTVTAYEKNVEPRKALNLMESMREEGYDFYDIKVLDAAFKQGVKLINNVVGNKGSSGEGD